MYSNSYSSHLYEGKTRYDVILGEDNLGYFAFLSGDGNSAIVRAESNLDSARILCTLQRRGIVGEFTRAFSGSNPCADDAMRFIGIETLVDGSIATIRRLPSSYDKVTLISSRQEDSARNIANLMGASSDAEVIARCADYRKRFRYTPLGFIYTKCGFAYDIDRRELGFVGNDTSQLEGFSVFPSVSESFSKMEETNFFLMSILARAGCIDMSRIKVDYIAGQIRDIQPDFIPREEGVYYASPDERRLAIAVSVAQQKWFEHLGTGKEAWLSAENHWISGGYPFALETILYPGDIMEFLSGMNTSERIRCMEEYFAYLTNLYGLTGDEDDPIPESVWGETAGASAENERKILRQIRQTLEDNHTPAA